MSITFHPHVLEGASQTVIHQVYNRLGITLGIPPQIAQKIYKGQNLNNLEICKFYTSEYNVYLMSMLSDDELPDDISPESLELVATTEHLEELYNERMQSATRRYETGEKLLAAIKENNFAHFLIALNMEPKPMPYWLNKALEIVLLSTFDRPTDEKNRMIKILSKNGATPSFDFGHTILNKLAEKQIHTFDLPLFEWIVSSTKEKFSLCALRDFLDGDYCKTSDELINTVDFFLQNPSDEEPLKDDIISQVVQNCLTFENSDELLDLLQESKLQGDCHANLAHILNAVETGAKIEPNLARFFVGDAAQSKLQELICELEQEGVPSPNVLNVLTKCGAFIDEQFLIELLKCEYPDDAITLTLGLMNEIPGLEAMYTAMNVKKFEALRMMFEYGASPTEHMLHEVIASSSTGEKPSLELITLLVKGGAPAPARIWSMAQAWDRTQGWDLEKTLIEAGASIPE